MQSFPIVLDTLLGTRELAKLVLDRVDFDIVLDHVFGVQLRESVDAAEQDKEIGIYSTDIGWTCGSNEHKTFRRAKELLEIGREKILLKASRSA